MGLAVLFGLLVVLGLAVRYVAAALRPADAGYARRRARLFRIALLAVATALIVSGFLVLVIDTIWLSQWAWRLVVGAASIGVGFLVVQYFEAADRATVEAAWESASGRS